MFKKLSFLFLATVISVCGFASTLKVEKIVTNYYFDDCLVLEDGSIWDVYCDIKSLGIRIGDELEINDANFNEKKIKHLPSGRLFLAFYLGKQKNHVHKIKKSGKVFLPGVEFLSDDIEERFIKYAILSDGSLWDIYEENEKNFESSDVVREAVVDFEKSFINETKGRIMEVCKLGKGEATSSTKTLKKISKDKTTIDFKDNTQWKVLVGKELLKKNTEFEAFSFNLEPLFASLFSMSLTMEEEKGSIAKDEICDLIEGTTINTEWAFLYPKNNSKKVVIACRKK